MTSRVSRNLGNGITVHAEGESIKETFHSLARLMECFGEKKCGCCGGTNLSYRVREVKSDDEDFEFCELVCQNSSCRAKLEFGLKKDGKTLYPKRVETNKRGQPIRDGEGKVKYLPNNGWSKWEPNKDEE